MPLKNDNESAGPSHAARPATLTGSAFLERVVTPVLKEHLPAPENGDGPKVSLVRSEEGVPFLHAHWRDTEVLRVAFTRRDEKRATLAFTLMVGCFLEAPLDAALQVGAFLEGTPFHVHLDHRLVLHHDLVVGCELAIHVGDTDLVRERTRELVQLAYDLEWFCVIYLPQRLGFLDIATLAIAFGDDLGDMDALRERLESGLRSSPGPDEAVPLAVLARGLGRWRDLLRTLPLATGPDSFAAVAPLAARAWQDLGRWDRVLEMARRGEIAEGRYPGSPWLSPCHLRALIETGNEIEALRLLARPGENDPGFHDLLRGRALFAAGDRAGSEAAFERYFERWPGDLAGQAEAGRLFDEGN